MAEDTFTENPLSIEEAGLSKRARRRKEKNAQDAEDDGGEESVSHFIEDVFGHWFDDHPTMDQAHLADWTGAVLGVDMDRTELQHIFDHICVAGGVAEITPEALVAWWQEDVKTYLDDNEECQFRRAVRLRGVFASAKSSLLVLADPTESHLATRRLFQRINVVCDYHTTGRHRITVENLRVLADDLGIEVDDAHLASAVDEMDPTHGDHIEFHPFEEWWLHGEGMDKEGGATLSTLLHSMLRLGGLLMCAHGGTVFGIWNCSTAILGSEEMRASVERALDKIARNADHHHFEQMVDRLHSAEHSLRGLLHQDDRVKPGGHTLGVFGPESLVRRACTALVNSDGFELFVLLCIFGNVLGLIVFETNEVNMDRAEDGTVFGRFDDFFGALNLFVAVVFTVEMVARIIAGGLIKEAHAYLRNGWNIFDGFVVSSIWFIWLCEWLGWIGTDSNVAFTLTAFRAFRSLRFFEGTRQIVATLGQAKETLSMIVTLMFVLFVMFSVMGREAFAGALTRTCEPFIPQNYTDFCTGEIVVAGGGRRRQLGGGATQGDLRDLFNREDGMLDECWAQEKPVWYEEKYTDACPLTLSCTTEEHGCWEISPLKGPKWREHHIDKYGFDDMGTAILTVFQVTARDEWMRIANPIWETTLSTSWAAWIFFMAMFVLLGLMCVNLFLASITLAYLDLQKEIRQEQAIRSAHESLVGALLEQSGALQAAQDISARSRTPDGTDGEGDGPTDCRGRCPGAVQAVQPLVTHPHKRKFSGFIMSIVVLNVIAMAMESYQMDPGTKNILSVCEVVFTAIYTFEAAVKILGKGFREYFRKGLNRLDFVIVISALLSYAVQAYADYVVQSTGGAKTSTDYVVQVVRASRIIRGMRALRLLKLLLQSKAIEQILGMAFASLSAVMSLLYMIFLTLTVASISGVFIFDKCHGKEAEGTHLVWTRAHYGDLGSAFMSNFQLFTEDNWANFMFEYQECMGSRWVALYFVLLFCTLNFVLLVIFVSIFLDNFNLSDEGKRQKQIDLYVKSIGAQEKEFNLMDMKAINMAVRFLYTGGGALKRANPLAKDLSQERSFNPVREMGDGQLDELLEMESQVRDFKDSMPYGATKDFDDLTLPQRDHLCALSFELGLGLVEKTDALGEVLGLTVKVQHHEDFALGCGKHQGLRSDHPFRVAMRRLVEHIVFRDLIVLCIALSGVCLAVEGPYEPGEPGYYHSDEVRLLLSASDVAFYVAFLVECLGKIVAYGFIDTPNAYLSSATNCFDFFVVIVTTVDLILWITLPEQAGVLNIFRLLRSLRLVRLLEHVEGLSVMAHAIWRSLPACGAVMAMLLGNMVIFAIFGMNLFMGSMHSCSYDDTLDHVRCECSGHGYMVDETGQQRAPAFGVGMWTDDAGGDHEIRCECDAGYVGSHCQLTAPYDDNGTMVNSTLISTFAEDPWCEFAGDGIGASGRRQLGGGGAKAGWCEYVDGGGAPGGRRQLGGGGGGGNPWRPRSFNYDNFGDALRSLVVLTTRQGWHELFFYATDTVDVELAPSTDANFFWASVFHVLFIMINGFMLEELFIGMLVEIFSQSSGTVLLTETQKKWRYLQMYVFHFTEKNPEPPDGWLRRACYDVTMDKKNTFQKGMILIVCINIAMLIYDENAPVRRLEGRTELDIFNDICVLLYTLEILIKAMAHGFKYYVRKHLSNLAVVGGLWVVCIHAHLQHNEILVGAALDWIQVFQCLRVWKLFKVLSHFSSLKKLVHTLKLSLPQVVNVILLMLMTYFIGGIMAMKLYGNIEIRPGLDGTHSVEVPHLAWIGDTNNFGDVFHAMKLLFQISTGNPLPMLINDIQSTADMPGSIVPFIFVFFVLSNFIFLNVFIALLLENFEYNLEGEFAIEEVEVDSFKASWDASKDVQHGMLSIGKLDHFMLELTGPLSVVVETDPFWHNRLLLELDSDAEDQLRDEKCFVFHEVMLALCRMRFGNSCLPFDLEIEADEKLKLRTQNTAARLIQICWLAHKMGRKSGKSGVDLLVVEICRYWVRMVAIHKSRISARRLKTEMELEEGQRRVDEGAVGDYQSQKALHHL